MDRPTEGPSAPADASAEPPSSGTLVPVTAALAPEVPASASATEPPATRESISELIALSAREVTSIERVGTESPETLRELGTAAAPTMSPTPPLLNTPAVPPAYPNSRLPAPLLLLSEYWYARRTSRRLVALCRRINAEQPATTGRALYEDVIIRWAGVERSVARTMLVRAAQSFVDWNTDRDLRFRDVVLSLIAHEYMTIRPERRGVVGRMTNVIARTVPIDL